MENILANFVSKLKVKRTDTFGWKQRKGFDDFIEDKTKETGKKIIGIQIRHAYIVDAIGLMYKDKKMPLHGGIGGKEQFVVFDEGDELKSIEGIYGVPFNGKAISKLVIHTKNGKTYGPFGYGTEGETFQIEIPEKGEFLGFYGTAEQSENAGYLESLGLIYCEGKQNLLHDISDLLSYKQNGE